MEASLAMANDALRIRIGIWLTGYRSGSSSSHFQPASGSIWIRRYLVSIIARPRDLQLVDGFEKQDGLLS